MELTVDVTYDEDARVYMAQNDAFGLATDADTLEALTRKLREMIPELAELNGIDLPNAFRSVQYSDPVRHPLP